MSDGAEPPSRLETAHGQAEPELLGWTFEGDRGRTPSWTVRLESSASSAILPTAIVLGAETPVPVRGRRSPEGYEVDLDLAGAATRLAVLRREDTLEVAAR